MLSRDGEGRARYPASKEIDLAVILATVDLADITFVNVPLRHIEAKRLARVRINLDRQLVVETRKMQTQRLSAGTGADLQAGQSTSRHSSSISNTCSIPESINARSQQSSRWR
ncbi:hypothetical protein MHPYR_600010 [uncultured Mycobacterium sp.]|uniref:Uncharacterized protein n=1 Tax=uncultured Mycobacterium sp. TaxID=171292 RepID=A0A1Y5PJ37_9MYCO|nr:hypothetical protein MHPYR_600010 [uncultured Mycobacterium sp.]